MVDIAVINASPLIFLARGGHLELLPQLYQSVLVPSQVAEEIVARGKDDATAQALQQTQWLEVAAVEEVPASVESWSLGAGESAVIALALSTPGAEAIMDDLAGRKCATSGFWVRSTDNHGLRITDY